jgi:hypothetical protein
MEYIMESEISLAWKQGYVNALQSFTLLDSAQQWKFASEAWKEVGQLTMSGEIARNIRPYEKA